MYIGNVCDSMFPFVLFLVRMMPRRLESTKSDRLSIKTHVGDYTRSRDTSARTSQCVVTAPFSPPLPWMYTSRSDMFYFLCPLECFGLLLSHRILRVFCSVCMCVCVSDIKKND
jgi:hypothetical protein